MAANFNIPTAELICRGDGNTQIVSNFAALLNADVTPLDNSVTDGPVDVFTGSNGEGAVTLETCAGWTRSTAATAGQVGAGNLTNSSFINDGITQCGLSRPTYCFIYATAVPAASSSVIEWE
ncbi:hypothetical protein [Alteromonas gilva]|uniref:Uncharacterized protein n=1 Tax=Alteromonas gilva TaxID=2987522 RepID=A0ABT5L2E1_9ALTE|nr:hypothetical protein [Alteromonas gilva]MDC8831192.1 hypothetical protein [Alteromonas gilva]